MPIPGTPPGAANDSTVASVDVNSGEEQDGFVSVVSLRRSRRSGGHRVTSTTVFPIQVNRFAAFDAEFARNDRLEHESESDTVSVRSRHHEGPRQRRSFVLLSSGTLATAIDSPDSHDKRFQRVRRAMQERLEALTAADQHDHSASEDHSEASVQGHVDATEPLRMALRVAKLMKKRPSVMRSVPPFLRGSFREVLRLVMEEAVSEEVIRQERGWKLMLLFPRMLLQPSTTGRFDCQR